MKVTVVIPTCSTERNLLLMEDISSIMEGTYKDVHIIIVSDGNQKIYDLMYHKITNVTVIMNEERIGWIASMNRVLKEYDSEYYIYASDDLIFPLDCIENAMATMQKRFPDGYGLVTISKKNRCPFGLIGTKLVDHFPERQVFCPDYRHYCSDTEFKKFVMDSDLFAFPPERESQVKHHRLNDDTRRIARQVREIDFAVRAERRERGYLWGNDFNLVGELEELT